MSETDAWLNPPLSCDLVMKGGITSGVVYPGAVVKLAKRYRFRNIGGTSAGAIAAVAVAAAEYGRPQGFRELAGIPGELGRTVGKDPFVLTLFRPEPSNRKLFRALLGFERHGLLRGALGIFVAFWRFPVAALALAAIAIVLALFVGLPWVAAIALIALAPWIALGGVLRDAYGAFRALSETDFGLCRVGPSQGGEEALTVWLHGVIQRLAGREPRAAGAASTQPLTFADLWGVPPLRGDESPEELAARHERLALLGWNAAERTIDLQVMTTNLTVGRPMRLPIARDRWRDSAEEGGLLFDPEEWQRFFPAAVVEHMVRVARAPEAEAADMIANQHPDGHSLLYFPGGADLPVVVAARMSLSFPVLISTVPLWKIQYREDGNHKLRRMIFSDGGISSNFPVHFFDAPLPTRPTFALNLAGFEPEEQPRPGDPRLDDPHYCVRDPASVTGRSAETWKPPTSMFGFFVAIKDVLENWRDNSQLLMPGFRERVIHIKLAHGEGGLNIAIDADQVRRLTDRGSLAAERLMTLFSGPEGEEPTATEHWNDHRFARFRTFMSVLERLLQRLQRGYADLPDAASVPYDTRIARGGEGPYRLTGAELQAATETLGKYLSLGAEAGETLDDDNVPRPRAVARIGPSV
jgi:predicted acylesterase/phospholipase RssA